jgi:hypothetical protein
MKRMRSLAVRLLAVAAIALLLPGCLKLNMDLSVSSDNTVSGKVIFAVDKQLLQATGQSVDEVIGENPIASPGEKGVTTTPYEDDTFVGQTVTFDAVPIPQFGGVESSDTLQIVREGDQFKVTGVMDLSTGTSTGDPQLDQMLQEALKTADIRITMTFPGEVVSSNGSIDGNSVTWEPKIGERTEIQAVAKATGGSSFPWLLIVIAAVVVLVVVVVVFVLSARGKKGAVAPEEAATGGFGEAPPAAAETPAAETPPLAIETPPPAFETPPPAVETPPPPPPAPSGDDTAPPAAPTL